MSDTVNKLKRAEYVFETLLDILTDFDEPDIEFRIYLLDKGGVDVPVLAYVCREEEVINILPIAELLIDSSEEVDALYTDPEKAPFIRIILNSEQEEECLRTSERSPESFFILNNGKKH